MTITCPNCAHENPDGTEFCDVCGTEMTAANVVTTAAPETIVIEPPISATDPEPYSPPPTPFTPDPEPYSPLPVPPAPEIFTAPIPDTPTPTPATTAKARLVSKKQDVPTSEFALESNNVIGKFDPDMGPVEVDLEEFPGAETISRQHAEIYRESDLWKIKDIGSTNGVFIKRAGQPRFGARITTPETIEVGDEIAFGKINFIFQSP
jgi:FHA domain/zinc-ribbon domain